MKQAFGTTGRLLSRWTSWYEKPLARLPTAPSLMIDDLLPKRLNAAAGAWAGMVAGPGIVLAARRLRRRGRRQQAEALLIRGLTLWPRNLLLLKWHALGAHDEGRNEEAIRRWHVLLAIAPGSAIGLSGLAAKHRELQQLEQAETTIASALALHPDHPLILVEAARLADRRYDHGKALALWQRLLERPKASPEWRQLRDWNLIMLGRLDEADAAIETARQVQPEHRGHLANTASLRMAQNRWDEAIAALQEFRSRYPDDPVGPELMGQAREGAAFAAADALGTPHTPVAIERVEDEATRALLLRFESLGADCEFGLVQRRYGAEPLGLLRWNKVTLPLLLDGLAARFEGLGSEADTELGVFELGEYRVRDRRYGLSMHTFVYRHQVEPEVLLAKSRKRLGYLRAKLFEDLEAADKVFVYKRQALDIEAMRSLHRELRAFGAVRLLCVLQIEDRPASMSQVNAGELVELDDGLYVGIVSRYGILDGVWNIVFADWVAICSTLMSDLRPQRGSLASAAGAL